MNFSNHFRETWTSRFPNEEELPELDCLKADQFSGVMSQKAALEAAQHEIDAELEEIKSLYHRKLFLHDYLYKCINKLGAISRVFDDFDGGPTSTLPAAPVSGGGGVQLMMGGVVGGGGGRPSIVSSHQSGGLPMGLGHFGQPSPTTPMMDHMSQGNAIKLESELDLTQMIPVDTSLLRPHHLAAYPSCYPPSSEPDTHTPQLQQQQQQQQQQHNSAGSVVGDSKPGSLEARPYRCPVCSRGFAVKAGVMQHMRTHTGERPYPCGVCGRAFRQKIQLTTHMRVHSGERPYGCKLCGKLFRQQSHVVQHLRTHTGEKPHKCFRCGKAFRQKYSLIAHHRRMCRNRQATNPIAPGMTMWIGPSSIPGGATIKSLAPTTCPPHATVVIKTNNVGGEHCHQQRQMEVESVEGMTVVDMEQHNHAQVVTSL